MTTPPRDSTIHRLVWGRVAQGPDRVAVRSGDRAITYADLKSRSEQLASWLRRQGVGRADRVALVLSSSIEAVIAILAVLECGAAWVPLEPSGLSGRSWVIVRAARPTLVLTHAHLLESLELEVRRCAIEDALDQAMRVDAEPSRAPPARDPVGPRDLAYVIYTSGSSGHPRGVAIEHGSLCNLVMAQIDAFEVGPGDCVLQYASLAFDASVSEIMVALVAGATLRVASPSERALGEGLRATLRDGVTTVTLPPSMLAVLPHDDLPALRTVVSAGEPCSDRVVERWSPGRRFINAYGPTEGTVCATLHVRDGAASCATIGTALPGIAVYVLDPRGRPVPPGVRGELYIGGVGVARGYDARPGATAERFVPDPFVGVPGARMYRTGDLVRRRPGGALEFIGRGDRQLEILGQRIEPREIEAALLRHDEVVNAAVIGAHAGTPEARLVAHVVPRSAVEPSELQAWLRGSLPETMIPSRIVVIPTMPLTANGKIDFARLSAPEDAATERRPGPMPRTAVEHALARLWCETLGLESVSITDDFFALGGQSVLAVRLLSRIEETWGRVVPMAALLEERTIQHLASLIHDAHRSRRRRSPIIELEPGGGRPPLLLCHALGGSALCYLGLTRELPDDQPAWGLESPVLHTEEPPPSSVRQAASRLVDTVMEALEGPCTVAGWSFGGVVAFELALELERRHGDVRRVFLLDPGPPRPTGRDRTDLMEMVGGFARRAGLPFDPRALAALDEARQLEQMRTALEAAMPPATASALLRELEATAAHVHARQVYVPSGVLAAPLTLFRATSPAPGDARPDPSDRDQWAALTRGSFESTEIASSHEGLLTNPHAATIAAAILDADRSEG